MTVGEFKQQMRLNIGRLTAKGGEEMTMLSIPRKYHEQFKKLAERDGRSMRSLFKVMIDKYEAYLDNK